MEVPSVASLGESSIMRARCKVLVVGVPPTSTLTCSESDDRYA